MKVGDLVRCTWQPRASRYAKGIGCLPMKYIIKGEVGIYIKRRDRVAGTVSFPQFGYEQTLAHSILEIVNESR